MRDNPVIDVEIRTRISERAPTPYWLIILVVVGSVLSLSASLWMWVHFIRWACR